VRERRGERKKWEREEGGERRGGGGEKGVESKQQSSINE
jgi:hypothetical protein